MRSRASRTGDPQAPFVVLTGATMPSALVEVGFPLQRRGGREARGSRRAGPDCDGARRGDHRFPARAGARGRPDAGGPAYAMRALRPIVATVAVVAVLAALVLLICTTGRRPRRLPGRAASPTPVPGKLVLFFPGDDALLHREAREVPELPAAALPRIRLVLEELLAGSAKASHRRFPGRRPYRRCSSTAKGTRSSTFRRRRPTSRAERDRDDARVRGRQQRGGEQPRCAPRPASLWGAPRSHARPPRPVAAAGAQRRDGGAVSTPRSTERLQTTPLRSQVL